MRDSLNRLLQDTEKLRDRADALVRTMDTGNSREQVKSASATLQWTIEHLHQAQEIKIARRHFK